MAKNVIGSLLEAILIARTEDGVHQDVIGFERGVGFEFATPISVLMLLRKEPPAGRIDGGCCAAGEIINLAETEFRGAGRAR